jgi:hypothetical protein
MAPTQSVNPTLLTSVMKIEHSLARIAHALEELAKHQVPDFKTLDAQKRTRPRP